MSFMLKWYTQEISDFTGEEKEKILNRIFKQTCSASANEAIRLAREEYANIFKFNKE